MFLCLCFNCRLFPFWCSWYAYVVLSCWDFMLCLVDYLCSLVHLVGFSLGAFHGRLHCPMRCGWCVFFNCFSHHGMPCGCSHLDLFIAGYSAVPPSCALWFLSSPCGCWLCSTSLPNRNQIDSLPPAPSSGVRAFAYAHIRATAKPGILCSRIH